MKLIEKFKYVKEKNDNTGELIYVEGAIKTEVFRSKVNFYNSKGKFIEMDRKKVDIYSIKLFGYGDFKNVLSIKELEFIAKTYDLETIYGKEGDLEASLKHIHLEYLPGMMEYFIEDNKEYLIISFDRKSGHLPPQATEDRAYVFGIWENPLLTHEIITKIKQP